MVPARELRSQGDQDLADELLALPEIRQALERIEEITKGVSTRRQLLGTAMRLSPEMAPDVHAIMERCRVRLELPGPVETYVYPGSMYNAAAVRPERGRLFLILSSSLLEAFEPEELSFVVGHELGHHLFEHHRIPVGILLSGVARVSPDVALRLFAWQRYAEISADRSGLVCAGGLEPVALALFKLASGLRGGRVRVLIDQFLSQVGDIREEAGRVAGAGEERTDWLSTHPFSPLRLKAAQLFAGSELMTDAGMPRAELELQVQDLMLLMEPSYLNERSDVAETMRRLLFAAGVAVASVSGKLEEKSLSALEKLLGPGSLPFQIHTAALKADLPARIEAVKGTVPLLRRAQVVRDLCVIARADGRVDEAEQAEIRRIAEAVGVDPAMVQHAAAEGDAGCASRRGGT